MTFVINAADLNIRNATEVEEEFYFMYAEDVKILLAMIRFVLEYKAWKRPKTEKQALLEYRRRGYLFIMEKNSCARMRTKKPLRDLR